MKNQIKLLVIAAATAIFGLPAALAVPTVSLSDGLGHTTTLSNSTGSYSFTGNVGNFNLSLSTGVVSGDMELPSLTVSSLSLTGGRAATLTILLSDVSVGPLPGLLASQISGQTNGNVKYTTYLDSSNRLFATTTLVTNQVFAGNFNNTALSSSLPTSEFSVTEKIVIQESPGGTTSFSTNLTDPLPDGPAPAVPDSGSSAALLGLALVGIAAVRRKLAAIASR